MLHGLREPHGLDAFGSRFHIAGLLLFVSLAKKTFAFGVWSLILTDFVTVCDNHVGTTFGSK